MQPLNMTGLALSVYLLTIISEKVSTFSVQETNTAEFANSVDLDEVAYNEPPHLDLHCLPSSL